MLAGAWARVKAYGITPSVTFAITDPFVAYAVDACVARWGLAFDAALSEATSGAKDQDAAARAQGAVLRRWLPSQRRYR
jgi:hypothetical protein